MTFMPPRTRLTDPKRNYLQPDELELFKRQREMGRITFFRVAECKAPKADGVNGVCGVEIPNSKKWCSRKCAVAGEAAEVAKMKEAVAARVREAAEQLKASSLAAADVLTDLAQEDAPATPDPAPDPSPEPPKKQLQLPVPATKTKVL